MRPTGITVVHAGAVGTVLYDEALCPPRSSDDDDITLR